MSQENVEIVRRLLEASNRRDFDAMLETGDPEIEIVTLMSGTHRGHAGWRRVVEQMAEEVSGFQFVPEDLIDVGQDRVVAVTRWVGTGRTSGIALSQHHWVRLHISRRPGCSPGVLPKQSRVACYPRALTVQAASFSGCSLASSQV